MSDLLGSVPVTVYRSAQTQQFVNGRKGPDYRLPLSLMITVEPLSSRDLSRMERLTGRSLGGGLEVFCEQELKPASNFTDVDGDWLLWQGLIYQIHSTGFWHDPDLGHWECTALLMDPQPTPTPPPEPEEEP